MSNPAPIIAKNLTHLRRLIKRTIKEHGPAVDLNHIDVSSIVDFESLFKGTGFMGDISQWNMSNAVNLGRMFQGEAFNGDISKWDVSKVENMTEMFAHSKFDGDVSKWDVGSVRWMTEMFCASAFAGDVSSWNTVSLCKADGMFSASKFNGDVSTWNIKKLNNFERMFDTPTFQQDLSCWQLPEHATYQNMVHSTFRQKLPILTNPQHPYFAYLALISGFETLNGYLREMPFARTHAALLVLEHARCTWADEALLGWAKERIEMSNAIGLTHADTIELLLSQYANRSQPLDVADHAHFFECAP